MFLVLAILLPFLLVHAITGHPWPSTPLPPPDLFSYGCYSWTAAGPTDKPLQSCPPATVFSYLYYSKCVCSKLVDPGGFTYLNCASFEKPPDTSFTSLCTYTQIKEENTCSSITSIDTFFHQVCSNGISGSVSRVTNALCSQKKPQTRRKVVNVLNQYGIGQIVVNMLDVVCGANVTATVSTPDVSAICTGIETLSMGCSTNPTRHSSSTSSRSSISQSTFGLGGLFGILLALFI